jgi:hypothetical protein
MIRGRDFVTGGNEGNEGVLIGKHPVYAIWELVIIIITALVYYLRSCVFVEELSPESPN